MSHEKQVFELTDHSQSSVHLFVLFKWKLSIVSAVPVFISFVMEPVVVQECNFLHEQKIKTGYHEQNSLSLHGCS